jgi:hypothetical protein
MLHRRAVPVQPAYPGQAQPPRPPGPLSPGSVLSDAQRIVRANVSAHAPLIVLTEGTTDAEFRRMAFAVLYPHLTDLVRFLD